MQVELSKEKIHINKIIAEKSQMFFVEEDIIVPDSKPDILNSINVSGTMCIYNKEITQDKVKLEGGINTYVMYLPDSKNDNVRALNCDIKFSKLLEVNDLKEGMIFNLRCEIKEIECKVINGRKIRIKAGIEAFIKVYSNEEVDFIKTANNIEDLQTLNKDFRINSLTGSSKTSIYAKETIKLDALDELAEILQVENNLCNKEIKVSYNKVLTKAESKMKILYLTEDNRIATVEGTIPIIGFIDIPNVSEDNQIDINYTTKNITIKPNSIQDHSIYVELEVEANCMAYENKSINIIQDLYSPTKNLNFKQKRISSISNIIEKTEDLKINKNIKIQGIEKENIINIRANPIINTININKANITYIGEVKLNFIFFNENTLISNNSNISFEVTNENNYNSENINAESEIIIESIETSIKIQGEVEVNINAKIFEKTCENINMNIIEDIEIIDEKGKEDEKYDSLILYIAQPNDNLWKIAKKFNNTVEELASVNGIEESNIINVGQKIFIPKFKFWLRKNIENEPKESAV